MKIKDLLPVLDSNQHVHIFKDDVSVIRGGRVEPLFHALLTTKSKILEMEIQKIEPFKETERISLDISVI